VSGVSCVVAALGLVRGVARHRMTYDVAIVGAGPAGSWLARELARSGRRVVLLERSTIAGEPNFSSAVSPWPTPDRFDLPRQAIAATWDIGKVHGPKTVVTWHFEGPAGVVFDFRRLKCMLIEQGRSLGAAVLLGTTVKGVEPGDPVSSVLTESRARYDARVVVDASGTAAVLAGQLGLRREISAKASVGVELICRTDALTAEQRRTVEFYFGSAYVPHGYAWLFPMARDTLKVGLCVYQARNHRPLRLRALLTEFARQIPWLGSYEVIEKHSGIGYLQGGIRQHVSGNVLAIGDAADQTNPLGGEGIRHALESARLAKGVIEQALAAGGSAPLHAYNALWRSYTGLRWRTCAWIAHAMYGRFPDWALEFCAQRLGKLTPEEVFAVAFEYAPAPLLRALFRRRDRTRLSRGGPGGLPYC
jgi:digeranylgeranylglycerophospholipid reductase